MRIVVAFLISVALFPVSRGIAETMDVAAQRREALDTILHDDSASDVADQRSACALGKTPAIVAQGRADGALFMPDATDECVVALRRTGHDHALEVFYKDLTIKMGGIGEDFEKLPRAIGAAVVSGDGKVAIGNSKLAVVTSALAFDAGFTVAYEEGRGAKQATVDDAKLKSIAEGCLKQAGNAGTCFSVGYVYGAKAYQEPS